MLNTKSTCSYIIFFLLLAIPTSSYGQVQIGPSLGVIWSRYSDSSPEKYYYVVQEFKSRNYIVGATSNIHLSQKLSVQVDADYYKTGARIVDYTADDGGHVYFDANYLRVSILPTYRFYRNFRIAGGAYINRILRANHHQWSGWTGRRTTFRDEEWYDTYNTGLVARLEYRLGRLALRAQYTHPLQPIGPDFRARRLSTLQTSAAFYFGKQID
ncbi:outer membrane beta-barrel protein [Lewinella sp. 4G2]|uniref:outer membrane beta-barrel protein n=1 Tax=Lewinella sp. 4G2 TaxID=1803372 RepID=UPI0007B46A3B|nr:outer membrane beta-barrel protein [Lewinella sp. 4G2]OAV45278.1 hypothetical protein A3850_012585 [Lewinella sp. 4G2]